MILRPILVLVSALCVALVQTDNSHGEEPTEKALHLETGLYYTIRKGDTLWDLSEHFFDSPWVWPDLWGKNKQIPNPHWIYPGERIRVFGRKGMGKIPRAELRPKSPLPVEVEAVVEWKEPAYYLYPAIDSVGFIKEKRLAPRGSIFKVKGDKKLISAGDVVYVRPFGDVTFEPGHRFSVFRTLGHLKSQDTRAIIGIQHYIVGVVEVAEVEPKFSITKVVQSFRAIKLNDLLMPYEERSPKITLTESKKGLEGKIIVSEEHANIFAHDAVVFIDRGRKDGVRIGQSYSVYYQEKERLGPKAEESVLLSPVDFGKILVLRTEETTATALVTMADKAVEPWATIHTPSP